MFHLFTDAAKRFRLKLIALHDTNYERSTCGVKVVVNCSGLGFAGGHFKSFPQETTKKNGNKLDKNLKRITSINVIVTGYVTESQRRHFSQLLPGLLGLGTTLANGHLLKDVMFCIVRLLFMSNTVTRV